MIQPDILNISITQTDFQDIPNNVINHDNERYAVLKRRELDCDLDRCPQKNNKIKFCGTGIVNKIILLDFPVLDKCELQLNGCDVSIGKYKDDTQTYEFDFSMKLSDDFNLYETKISEPIIENDDTYINLDKVYCCVISLISQTVLNFKHHIRYCGYFVQNNEWINGFYDETIYPYDTLKLPINHPTDSLDIKTDNDKGFIILRIHGHEYGTFKSSTDFIRLKFKDEELVTIGAQNKFLPKEINKQSINCSRIDSLEITTLNCNIMELHQNCYVIFYRSNNAAVFKN